MNMPHLFKNKVSNYFLSSTKERSDNLMDYFLIGYFVVGLLLASFYDTWIIAIGVGGLLLTAYYSCKKVLPNSNLYQYVLSAIYGVFMAQFIYQMHGLFEMHFFAFIGSALLITYQKWRLQLPMLIVVVIHHALFSYLQNSGFTKVYFTQLDYYDLQTFALHILLTAVIFFISGLWSYQFKRFREVQLSQNLQMAELKKEAEISIERKRRKEALEERNIILESIGDGFFAVDKNWVVTYWNSMAKKIFNKPDEQIIGLSLWEIFPESAELEAYYNYQQSIKASQPVHFETYYKQTNGWYQVSAYPSPNGLSVYFQDITKRKASESQLEKLNKDMQAQSKELARSNEELEQFAYVASHDLQEPLRMVSSFMGLLEKKYSDIIDDKGKQYIHFAVDGSLRMKQIILDLLEYSRIGRTEDKLQEIDLNQLLPDIISLYNKQIEETKAEVLFTELPVLRSFKAPLRQVFQNLIGNALKYQKVGKKPNIRISVEDAERYWRFYVKDNGIGMCNDDLEKIFIIFQRLNNKNEYQGTGLGLAVTKKIVENLGGKIWVTSEVGIGSTFYFDIPKEPIGI